MTFYFIDYPTATGAGLEGIDMLGENDKVFIYYTPKHNRLSLETMANICKGKATISILNMGKQPIELRLAADLGYLISKENLQMVAVITKDKSLTSLESFVHSISGNISFIAKPSISLTLGENIPDVSETVDM